MHSQLLLLFQWSSQSLPPVGCTVFWVFRDLVLAKFPQRKIAGHWKIFSSHSFSGYLSARGLDKMASKILC